MIKKKMKMFSKINSTVYECFTRDNSESSEFSFKKKNRKPVKKRKKRKNK